MRFNALIWGLSDAIMLESLGDNVFWDWSLAFNHAVSTLKIIKRQMRRQGDTEWWGVKMAYEDIAP
jgi:hypothetical protein